MKLHFHKYGEWQDVGITALYGDGFGNSTNFPTGRYLKQISRCKICGKAKIRKINL